ncbi:MAG: hypothetical protein M0T72_10390 [Candidatus Dormibacteraeota bacterium]|nr:hypothetical protein [Candidatus Dormibacteraeota bacterium]
MKLADIGLDPKPADWLEVGLRLSKPDAERVRQLMARPGTHFTYFGQACRYLVEKGLEAEGL